MSSGDGAPVVFAALFSVLLICLILDCVYISVQNNTPVTTSPSWHYFGQPVIATNGLRVNITVGDPKENVTTRMMRLDEAVPDRISDAAQQQLLKIYKESILPLEKAFHFPDLNRDVISEGEMLAKPMILFLGPWSTGKTSIINYLLNLEKSDLKLRAGAEPTTTDFTVMMHGKAARSVKGIQLVSDRTKHYAPLHKFGLNFLERLQGLEIPSPLLERVILVDTPGIIENKKQQTRGYPFGDVCQWFIDRAHLVFIVFDPSKLDIGTELETVFQQLKNHAAKLRLILNKADMVTHQELMRVYGALFWSLAPMVNQVEPPRMYVGSLWSKPYRAGTMHSLFEEEEMALLADLHHTLRYQIEYKVAATRRHAFLVRLHALTVESYRQVFKEKKGLVFGDGDKLWQEMISNPDKFVIYNNVLQNEDVSIHDLPTPELYRRFFAKNNLANFKPLSYYCKFWGEGAMDKLLKAINVDLPKLLQDLRSGRYSSWRLKFF